MKRYQAIVVSGMIFLLTVVACLGLAVHTLDRVFTSPGSQAARATESALTISHGIEARLAIQVFIDRNWSFAAFRNPDLLTEVATGQNLNELQALRREWSSGTIDVISSASINKIQVIDYTVTQFKAFSCEILNFDTLTIDGTYVSAIKPLTFFRIYVFNRENGVWKVAAWADFTDADHIRRDWEYAPQWEKNLIGDLPDLIDKYDTCF